MIICSTNEKCNSYNEIGVKSCNSPMITIKAIKIGSFSKNATVLKKQKKIQKKFNDVDLCVNASVMITKNIDVKNKIVNGTIGVIKNITQNLIVVDV